MAVSNNSLSVDATAILFFSIKLSINRRQVDIGQFL